MNYIDKSRKGDMFYKGDFIYLYTVDFASELNGFVFSCLNNSLEGLNIKEICYLLTNHINDLGLVSE